MSAEIVDGVTVDVAGGAEVDFHVESVVGVCGVSVG